MTESTNLFSLELTPEEHTQLLDGLSVLMMGDEDDERYDVFESIYNKVATNS